MTRLLFLTLLAATLAPAQKGWMPLFNGKNLDGWKASENPDTFKVVDGMIVSNGKRSHLFYIGRGASWKNFELKVDAKTEPNSNGGIYVHTAYQETGWPLQGFEIQVNNTYKDPRKTGSLYAVKDVMEAPAKDGEWFTLHITVKDDEIGIQVNGKETTSWKQPSDWAGIRQFPDRKINRGTIALQGHDPGSTVYYKSIMIRPLP